MMLIQSFIVMVFYLVTALLFIGTAEKFFERCRSYKFKLFVMDKELPVGGGLELEGKDWELMGFAEVQENGKPTRVGIFRRLKLKGEK